MVSKRWVSLVILLALSVSTVWARPQELNEKKLIVVIVVDQMRQDHLNFYRELMLPAAEGGFRRLIKGGVEHTRAVLDHFPTHTAAGHATLLTGCLPSVHGIVGNRWSKSDGEGTREAGEDPEHPPIGGADAGFSPRDLIAPTLGDALKRASGGASRLVSVCIKNRAAAFCTGRAADLAVWFDQGTGNWVTSDYYVHPDRMPLFLGQYNQAHHPDKEFPMVWEAKHLPATLPESIRAARLTEGYAGDYVSVGESFPHTITGGEPSPGESYHLAWSHTPRAVEATFDLALDAVEHYQMGRDAHPDLLVVGVSGLDKVGHVFGPNSPQSLEMLLEIDHRLAAFLTRLERSVKLSDCLVVLTSDHGSLTLVEQLREVGSRAFAVPLGRLESEIDAALAESSARGVFSDPYIWIQAGPEDKQERDELLSALVQRLEAVEGVHRVLRKDHLMQGRYRRGTLEDLVARSVYPKRTGDLIVIFEPNVWAGFPAPGGTNHSSPWLYDRHVPLVVYGWPGRRGVDVRTCAPRQIVPTLCEYFGLTPPAACDVAPLPWLAEGVAGPASKGGTHE